MSDILEQEDNQGPEFLPPVTRDVLDKDGNVIGSLTLSGDTTEEAWTFALAHYLHVPTITTDMIIDGLLERATDFGNQMIRSFEIANVKLGITQYGKTKDVSDYCHWMNHYLGQGSLYAAVQQINIMLADTNRASLNLTPFITDDVLNSYKSQINNYLGV